MEKSMDEIKCVTCGQPAFVSCGYDLRGSKLGSQCNRPLCRKHLIKRDGKILCLTHANYRMPVAVKELIVPFQFVIPVERQLSAGEIIAIDLPPEPKPVVNRLALVKDMKELVYELFQEEPQRGKPSVHFMAAMIMISPMFMPFDALTISKAINYSFILTKRAMERMSEFKICYRENEQLLFQCSWCALFADGSQTIINDGEKLFQESVAFVLDAMVVEGRLTRHVDEDGKFLYGKNAPTAKAERIQEGFCIDCGKPRGDNGTTVRCRVCANKVNLATGKLKRQAI